MRRLIIDGKIERDIQRMVDYAKKHPYSVDDMLDIMNGEDELIAGNIEDRTVVIPNGFKVVYSIEQQPMGLSRHLSMSVDEDNKLPSVAAVELIMKMVGFKNDLATCHKYIEPYEINRSAINVLEVIED